MNLFLSILLFVNASVASAVGYKFEPGIGKVHFLAKGRPALISIKGEGEGVSGKLLRQDNTLSGTLSFRLDSLKTGIDLRDDHMKKKYLEVEKFPQAQLKIEKLTLPVQPGHFSFVGQLTLHGVEQKISGEGTLSGKGEDTKVAAEFVVNLSKFKIEIPGFQGITVAEEVLMKIESDVIEMP